MDISRGQIRGSGGSPRTPVKAGSCALARGAGAQPNPDQRHPSERNQRDGVPSQKPVDLGSRGLAVRQFRIATALNFHFTTGSVR